ncbi:MAG: 50S ribosomal protein L21 [Nitrospirota bacterium]|jgi:large subunit ribosomal protein L21
MYAVIETGGKQYRVASGESVKVEKLDAEPGSEVRLEKVLAVVKKDGPVFGTPYVQNASVRAEVLGTAKQRKVLVFKQKTRKGHRKLRGHRQALTTLRIKDIEGV